MGEASRRYFGRPAAYIGEGGSIPFMGMLGEKFPSAQFLVTGVLGPHSNAHGPNEFLHIPTGKRVSMVVADIGAGTGLFTRLFAKEVGPTGKVYAVDIAPKIIAHIERTCKEADIKNVVGVVCTAQSARLPPKSIDQAFICDTYHHFEFPLKTMASIHEALRPGGQVIVIDFHRIEGKSREWVLSHVRAGQETVTKEIVSAGFKKVGEEKLLKENYFLRFEKVESEKK